MREEEQSVSALTMNITTINLIVVLIFSALNNYLLSISSKFIQSKPPGSRMVTSDLNIFLNKTLLAASWILTIILVIRILAGPLGYWMVLLCLGRL